jgi:hypothetical protein
LIELRLLVVLRREHQRVEGILLAVRLEQRQGLFKALPLRRAGGVLDLLDVFVVPCQAVLDNLSRVVAKMYTVIGRLPSCGRCFWLR